MCVWGSLGVGAGGQGTAMEEGEMSSALSCAQQVCPCPEETAVGVGAGLATAALWPGAFLSNFYGMQKEFFVLFCFL